MVSFTNSRNGIEELEKCVRFRKRPLQRQLCPGLLLVRDAG
jgi:hypothetical protein